MDNSDKIVATTLAAARCAALGLTAHDDFLAEYNAFLA